MVHLNKGGHMSRKRLHAVLDLLEAAGVEAWVAGGWAEEILGLVEPRAHKDIDLLYPAASFSKVDVFLASEGVEEVEGKGFPHKRAFLHGGFLVELLLLQPRNGSYVTDFWNELERTWPRNPLSERDGVRVASREALAAYRAWHPEIDRVRARRMD